MEASLADSGTQWHACLTIVGNRKLKFILLYYNALGRVPSRAKARPWQGRMRRARHIAGPYLLRYAQEASWREDIAELVMANRLTWFPVWR